MEEFVDFLHFVESFVEVELDFGNNSQLFALEDAEPTTDVGGVDRDGSHNGFFGGGRRWVGFGHRADRENADVSPSDGEVGCDANFGYGD